MRRAAPAFGIARPAEHCGLDAEGNRAGRGRIELQRPFGGVKAELAGPIEVAGFARNRDHRGAHVQKIALGTPVEATLMSQLEQRPALLEAADPTPDPAGDQGGGDEDRRRALRVLELERACQGVFVDPLPTEEADYRPDAECLCQEPVL